ncbi:MAG TPA: sigma-54 dependent transcriptional regulator [Gemmatimonadaceae bacterium]|nr:sigma-54 dependent transcriptional regulator [Gemmatimonadaceae bacterium]
MRILVVDDEPALRHTLSRILAEDAHETLTASDGEDALSKLATCAVDLVLCDLRMPGVGGLEFIDRYHAGGGSALIIAMSAYGDSDTAIAAMQRGAYDYIQKPFRADEVALVVRKAQEREKLRAAVRALEDELSTVRGDAEVVGRSASFQTALDVARKVARYPSTVLVTGESGTGKEVVARFIHRQSPRADAPFVAINCGAIPESLLESELFGHVKGAFTSANADKRGLFEEAQGGTLFLDEIGELPVAVQVKLLRALQEGEVRRVGATDARLVDVRVIAATNRDLAADVHAGRFRGDLYYRVNVVSVHLPALRDRPEDIPELALHFLARYNERLGLAVHNIAPAAMRLLVEYAWPGNVRELENVIERSLVLAGDATIGTEELPEHVRSARSPILQAADGDLSVKRKTAELEQSLIRRALERTRGNRTRAARLLDLSHRALLYKIREYGLG